MLKQDVFFMVLYGSFFAVMLTFIISFDGTNGFGKKNHIQTYIQAQFGSGGQVKPPPVGGKVEKKYNGGPGDKESKKETDLDLSRFGLTK